MKPIKLLVIVAAVLLSLQATAQKTIVNQPDHPQFKRLHIGDTVPMGSIVFKNVRNYPGGKAKLSDFKGKYIILDFWTKGCTACIAAFPHMEELQNEFKNDIQVLLVTKNTEEELALLSKNSMNLKNTKLPVVIGDQILATQLFPHESVPLHVWLDRAGKVVATTYAEETNSKNLKDLIAGKRMNLEIKNEVLDEKLLKEVENQTISLLKVGAGSFQDYLKYYAQIPVAKVGNKAPEHTSSIPVLPYYSMFMSYIPGDMMEGYKGLENSILLDDNGKAKGFRIAKFNVEAFYKNAYGVEYNTRIIAEGDAKNLYEEITDTTNTKRHLINNSYCYESCLPDYNFEKARKLLQQDLARFLGLTGSIEERPVKHLILVRLGTTTENDLWIKNRKNNDDDGRITKNKQGYSFTNYSIMGLLTQFDLANRASDDPIIIDGTTFTDKEKYNQKIDLLLNCQSLHATPQNIPNIQNELAKYGLGLKEETRNIKVLVLKASL